MNKSKRKKTVKQKTEAEAWSYLAWLWARPKAGSILPKHGHCLGICPAIDALHIDKIIDWSVSKSMHGKITRHAPPIIDEDKPGFRWRMHDTKSRAKFCRDMAKLCRKKEGS